MSAAHRDTFFRGLRDIRRDDVVTLSVSGALLRYRVKGAEIVGPRDVEVLGGTTEAELTLITCYPFYYVGPAPKRFVVHARLDPVGRIDRAFPLACHEGNAGIGARQAWSASAY